MALGLSLISFAQDKASTPAPATKAGPKVMMQIPDSAIKAGKVKIIDGVVYVRIGTERTLDGDSSKAVQLDDILFSWVNFPLSSSTAPDVNAGDVNVDGVAVSI